MGDKPKADDHTMPFLISAPEGQCSHHSGAHRSRFTCNQANCASSPPMEKRLEVKSAETDRTVTRAEFTPGIDVIFNLVEFW